MQEKSTYEVEEILKSMRPDQLQQFYKENSSSMIDEKKAFYYYMKDIVEAKRIFFKDIYIQSGVSESYGEQLMRMEKHTKNRDLIIRFCIAGHFSVDETSKALKLYGMSPLYGKDRRDACLITEINNRHYDMFKIDERLEEYGLKKISAD